MKIKLTRLQYYQCWMFSLYEARISTSELCGIIFNLFSCDLPSIRQQSECIHLLRYCIHANDWPVSISCESDDWDIIKNKIESIHTILSRLPNPNTSEINSLDYLMSILNNVSQDYSTVDLYSLIYHNWNHLCNYRGTYTLLSLVTLQQTRWKQYLPARIRLLLTLYRMYRLEGSR